MTAAFTSQPGELPHIDFIRLVAALGIMACHSLEFMVPREWRTASHAHSNGLTLFVDVFFVLSGFVIGHVYAGRLNSAGAFLRYLQKRIARLVPLHWATLLAATLLYAALYRADVPLNTRPDISAACLARAAALVHTWIYCGGIPPNGASWSISAELAMYLAFPLLLMLLRLPRIGRLLAFIAILTVCAMASGGLAPMSEAWSPLRAAPAFYLGVLLHREREVLTLAIPSWAPLAGCCALAAGSFLLVPRSALLVIAYGTAALAILADMTARPGRLVERLAPLGQLTYSIYMLHGLVILVVANAVGDKLLRLGQAGMIAMTLLSWSLVLLASMLSYALFERPARRAIIGLGAHREAAGRVAT